jgi:hypothetical protein
MKLPAALLLLALQDGSFKHENSAENLKQLFSKLHQAIVASDDKAALALTNSLLPDEAALKKGLKDDVGSEFVAQAVEFWKKITPTDDAKRARLFNADPANTDVRVHSCSTEDLLKYEKGSVAWMHFPGGANKLAEKVLRPSTIYHEVILAKPGEAAGMKFHLFYWTGERWSTLGPLWRALK